MLDGRERVVGLVALRDITGQLAKCKPHEVTFDKRLVSSSAIPTTSRSAKGTYCPRSEGRGVPAALAMFEQDRGFARWDEAADAYEFKEDD